MQNNRESHNNLEKSIQSELDSIKSRLDTKEKNLQKKLKSLFESNFDGFNENKRVMMFFLADVSRAQKQFMEALPRIEKIRSSFSGSVHRVMDVQGLNNFCDSLDEMSRDISERSIIFDQIAQGVSFFSRFVKGKISVEGVINKLRELKTINPELGSAFLYCFADHLNENDYKVEALRALFAMDKKYLDEENSMILVELLMDSELVARVFNMNPEKDGELKEFQRHLVSDLLQEALFDNPNYAEFKEIILNNCGLEGAIFMSAEEIEEVVDSLTEDGKRKLDALLKEAGRDVEADSPAYWGIVLAFLREEIPEKLPNNGVQIVPKKVFLSRCSKEELELLTNVDFDAKERCGHMAMFNQGGEHYYQRISIMEDAFQTQSDRMESDSFSDDFKDSAFQLFFQNAPKALKESVRASLAAKVEAAPGENFNFIKLWDVLDDDQREHLKTVYRINQFLDDIELKLKAADESSPNSPNCSIYHEFIEMRRLFKCDSGGSYSDNLEGVLKFFFNNYRTVQGKGAYYDAVRSILTENLLMDPESLPEMSSRRAGRKAFVSRVKKSGLLSKVNTFFDGHRDRSENGMFFSNSRSARVHISQYHDFDGWDNRLKEMLLSDRFTPFSEDQDYSSQVGLTI